MHIGTGLVLSTDWNHSHVVTGIHLYRSGGPRRNPMDEAALFTVSMDNTIQVAAIVFFIYDTDSYVVTHSEISHG